MNINIDTDMSLPVGITPHHQPCPMMNKSRCTART